jgi:XRE family transcriptional regulator, master regulator for biofilm formation
MFALLNRGMVMFLMRNLGERVRTLRTEKHITLPRLAEKANLSKGLLSKLENNEESNPSIDTLFQIAEALEVTLADILETESAQVKRIVPEKQPDWQKGLISYLRNHGKEPDQDILNAMYALRNRKAAKNADLEQWKFLYTSIENSFKK